MNDLDAILKDVESADSVQRTQAIIRQQSGSIESTMIAQEVKRMVEWFCEQSGIVNPTCKEEFDNITDRMIRIGLLSKSDLET